MNNCRYNTREEIKKHLRHNDYEIISMITKGKYKPGTVKMQMNGYRTLKEPVIEAANKLIESRERLLQY